MTMSSPVSGEFARPAEVLYFEDNPTDSLLVQSQFEKQSALQAKLTVVERLSDGLSLLQKHHFDAALLDLNLPDSQGMPSLHALRHAAPALPVIVVSGMVDDKLALELLGQGAQDCVSKSSDLVSRIAKVVQFALRRQQTAIELELRVREAEAARAHTRMILDASLDAVVVLDTEGFVRYLNPAAEAMFARKAGDMLGRPLNLPVADDETTEMEIVRRNGEKGTAEIHTVQVDWDGAQARLATLRDITGRKKMEVALRRGETLQALGTLAGGIAHDFNNILLAVSGNAKLALEQLSSNHPAHLHLLEIARAASRATALTRKILSFSREQETNRQPMKVEPVVEEALSLIRQTLSANIEIRRNFPANLPPILADASQLHQIIMNLATNAADAIGDKPGQLEISALPLHVKNGARLATKLAPGDYIKLSIKDSGAGMDNQTMARVFEPFFTTKPQGRGTGLGLPVVHGIMKNHGGEVTAYSEVGKGTVFNLYFPVASDEPLEPASPPVPAPEGRGQHILYVDDEEPLVLLVTRTLKRLGYRVTGFTDPVDALRALREGSTDFQAVVTDLSMPRMSGADFAHEVLQMCPAMPVVLTTGYLRPQDQELARRIGVRELILKPDTVEDLGIVLHRLLSESSPDGAALQRCD